METVIKIRPSELTGALVDNIKKLLKGKKNAEITISIHEKPSKKYPREEIREEYFARLQNAIDQAEKAKGIHLLNDRFIMLSLSE